MKGILHKCISKAGKYKCAYYRENKCPPVYFSFRVHELNSFYIRKGE